MPEVTLGKVLQATFPPASMTGAPKVRATEILRELEPVPRGIYSGAIGHCDALGNADFAVAIRGVYFEGDAVYVHAGGGIVYDSDADAEYEELLLKARAPLQALGVVV
jgi:anthranilate/para-aminobenzoate synthase component I